MWIASSVLTDQQRLQLTSWINSGKTPQAVAFRSRIILKAHEGLSNSQIAKELATSRPTVIFWRNAFKQGGIKRLHTNLPRGKSFVSLSQQTVENIIHTTLHEKPKEQTHWSSRALAKKLGVSQSSVTRVWDANNLKPWLVETFKLSNDKHFIEKLRDVVGLYLNPPEHALVFSVDEKTQIQALDRTQKALPLSYGKKETVTHDYKRHGTTTLFAALNILKGEVIGTCVKKHRHQEFISFLNKINTAVEETYEVHCIVDNYSTHKHEKVQAWLAQHPRFHLHFIPTSSSWLNLVERWFREITTKRIRRGVFHSVPELITAIENFIEENNKHPKPFVWTKTADEIIAKVNRCKAILDSVH
jgi:transposase